MTILSPRHACAAGLLGLGVVLLSACSGGGSGSAGASGSPAASASAKASGSAAFAAYEQCLSQHGVTLPSGRPSGGFGGYSGGKRPSGFPTSFPSGERPSGFPSGARPSGGRGFGGFGGASANPSFAAAEQACQSLRPQGGGFGGFGGGRGGGGQLGTTALAAFSSCMKDHGVTVPATGSVRQLNTSDPQTGKAYEICKALLPTKSPAPGASPSAS